MDKNGTAVSDIPADAFPGVCTLVLVLLACREGLVLDASRTYMQFGKLPGDAPGLTAVDM
jgi:hypothetical protein